VMIVTMEESSEKERKHKMKDQPRHSQKSLKPNNQQLNLSKLLQRAHLLRNNPPNKRSNRRVSQHKKTRKLKK
jgi:hypothetical protein